MYFAKIISHLFHPLFLPTAGLFLIFNMGELSLWAPPHEMQLFLYLITFSATCVLPLLNAVFLLKTKQIHSLEMKTKQERRIPYLATAIFYFSAAYLLMKVEVPALVKAMMMGASLFVAIVLLINLFWKISAHMAGIGGLCGMMIAISARLHITIHYLLIALFLVAGLLAFARLLLNAHRPAEVYVGFLLGLALQLVLFL